MTLQHTPLGLRSEPVRPSRWALAGAAALMLLLTACAGSVSRSIADDGSGAGEVRFPDLAAGEMRQRGVFVPESKLQLVKTGLNKPQIQALLGPPHFSEGLAVVREWDYVLNFHEADNRVQSCQFKVLFDLEGVARSFYWQPRACASRWSNQAQATPVASPFAAAPLAPLRSTRQFTLQGDALFAFGKSGLQDIQPAGRDQLDRLAEQLRQTPAERIDAIGYSDAIGSPTGNIALSQRRAQAVRSYLVSRGVPAHLIHASGRGQANPVVQCDQAAKAQRINCMAPNRRVEVEVVPRSTS